MSFNNQVTLVGNLGDDPTVNYAKSGTLVLSFRVATKEKWTDKSGAQKEETEWHSCVFFGQRAEEAMLHLHKGSYVRVEGKLKTDEFEKDCVKRFSTKIHVQNVAPAAFPRANRDTTPAPARNEVPFGGRPDPYAAARVDPYPEPF
jgi:single stranded DNA-binding protein